MRTFACLSALALLSMTLFAACGDDSSGPTCGEVCAKMVECGEEQDVAECTSMCDDFSAVMRSSAYEALGDCYMENSCDFLDQNSDYCFGQAAAKGDIGPVEDLFERMCTKMVSCGDNPDYTVQDCLDEFSGANGGSDDMYASMALFKASVLDCVGDCMEAADCAALFEDGMTDCFSSCGLAFMMSDDMD